MEIGNIVCYRYYGICRVTEIRSETVLGKTEMYYVLQSLSDNSTSVLVPLNSISLTSCIRPLLSKSEIDDLILSLPTIKYSWISDDQRRSEFFKSVISDCKYPDLIIMVRLLYLHKQKLTAVGKKMKYTDESFFKNSQSIVFNEFSFVLGLPVSDIPSYIDSLIHE